MYYFFKKDDGFVQSLLTLELGTAEPVPRLHYFGDAPLLHQTDYYEKCYNGKHLVLNSNTGTWCFLSAEEYTLLQAINNTTCQSLQERFPTIESKTLEEFIFNLYIRNIITINGQSFIEEHLFDDTPLKRVGALFIVEPTKRCNLHCSYCFTGSNSEKQPMMSKKSARRIIELILATDFDSVTIEFSGGEVLLAFDFIQHFIKELKKYLTSSCKKVYLTMQTNATLSTQEIKGNTILRNTLGTPLAPEQMQEQTSFIGWDFNNIWTYEAGTNNDFPVLRLMPKNNTVQSVTSNTTIENAPKTSRLSTSTIVETAPNTTRSLASTAVDNKPATLYIYRKRWYEGYSTNTRLEILLDNVLIGVASGNWKTTIPVNTFGKKTISTTVYGRKVEVQVNFEQGGVYYIQCAIAEGRAILQLVDKSIGESDFNSIKD